MKYNSIEEFKYQYNGQWSPVDDHWFGLDFMHNGESYRFNTWSEGNRNMDCLPDGRKIKFSIFRNISREERRYTLLGDYNSMDEVLASTVIDGMPFSDIILADDTTLLGQD